MQLSNKNLLKNEQIIQSFDIKTIVTKIEEKKSKETTTLKHVPADTESNEKMEIYQAEIQKLEKLKQDMLLETRRQAKSIEEEAYQKGFSEGQKVGEEQGYSQGIEKATVEAEQLTQIAQNNLFETQNEIKQMIQNQKEELVKLSVALAEKLTETIIDTKETIIADKIANFLEEIDYPQELIIIRVHEKYQKSVKKMVESKKEDWHHARISVLKEPNLANGNYSIETDNDFSLFDLQDELYKFMDNLLRDVR